jgi:hypothetical protein
MDLLIPRRVVLGLISFVGVASCAFRELASEPPVSPPGHSHPLPTRFSEKCAPKGVKISPADNAAVYSEWGHVTQNAGQGSHEFIRIVKNKEESGYALWYCEGRAPANGDFNAVSCWPLGPSVFEEAATDARLKSCGLFAKLKNNGFGLPSEWKIKLQLLKGPYPVQFSIPAIGTDRFCAGASDAFERCMGRR